jgi:uncharacterized protein (UPF0333 family)
MEEKENYYSTGKVQHTKTNAPTKSFTNPLLAIVVLIIVAVTAFFGGVAYEKGNTKKTPAASHNALSSINGYGSKGSYSGQRPILGSVTAVSSSSISVQDERTGTTSTLAITSSTVITNNGATVAASSISVGDTVAVRASMTNTNQASTILVNPSFGGGSGSSPSSPSSSSDSGVSTD